MHFLNGLDARINVQRKIAAVVHHVAAVDFPVVVFGPAAIHAVGDAAFRADHAFILPCLITYSRHQRDELREIPPVQLQLHNLFAGDGTAELRGLRVHLR